MEDGGVDPHRQFPTSHETEALFDEARAAAVDRLGGKKEEVAFGPNMTTLTFSISRTLAREWKPGDEIVVTEMDHNANVDPWLAVARDRGLAVRWIPVNSETLTVDLSDLDSIITERTKLVAVGCSFKRYRSRQRRGGDLRRGQVQGRISVRRRGACGTPFLR